MSLDNDWLEFLNDDEKDDDNYVTETSDEPTQECCDASSATTSVKVAPEATELYISTKTEIAFLNKELDLYNIFWKIPIINYDIAEE